VSRDDCTWLSLDVCLGIAKAAMEQGRQEGWPNDVAWASDEFACAGEDECRWPGAIVSAHLLECQDEGVRRPTPRSSGVLGAASDSRRQSVFRRRGQQLRFSTVTECCSKGGVRAGPKVPFLISAESTPKGMLGAFSILC
jgi:hypothetical protein